VILTSGFAETGAAGRALQEAVLAAPGAAAVRILGPNCLGVMRTDCGLNASFARTPARPGQPRADLAVGRDLRRDPRLGGERRGRLHQLGVARRRDRRRLRRGARLPGGDEATDAILMYVEGIRDARRFVSALRAAARVKPVVALKVGRYAERLARRFQPHRRAGRQRRGLRRGAAPRGSVRVKTYTQLFAAARVLASRAHSAGRAPRDRHQRRRPRRGRPPTALPRTGCVWLSLSQETIAQLDEKMPPQWSRGNPLDIIGDAPAERFARRARRRSPTPASTRCSRCTSPVAVTTPEAAAQAVADAARGSRKPVLAAWLGDINPNASRRMLESRGIPNFYTPENAVEAFSFLCAYRRNQAQLMRGAAAAREPDAAPPALAAAGAIRERALAERRTLLTEQESKAPAGGVRLARCPGRCWRRPGKKPSPPARDIGFPAVLKLQSPDITHKSDVGGVRLNLQNAEMVASAYEDMMRHVPHAEAAGAHRGRAGAADAALRARKRGAGWSGRAIRYSARCSRSRPAAFRSKRCATPRSRCRR
jgi:acetyltransferase